MIFKKGDDYDYRHNPRMLPSNLYLLDFFFLCAYQFSPVEELAKEKNRRGGKHRRQGWTVSK